MLRSRLLIRLQNVPVVVTAHGRTLGLEMEPNVVWSTRGRTESSGEVETAPAKVSGLKSQLAAGEDFPMDIFVL